jgi:hypothetical protein
VTIHLNRTHFCLPFSASTHDQDVFCFYPDERPCNGFSEALERYRELVPHLRLAGKLKSPCHPSSRFGMCVSSEC